MQLIKYFRELSLHPKNAKELKGLILQLAVQGKLTRDFRLCHPELREGPHSASALLDQIKAEKKQLIKEKKIKKEKPLPAISPEEIPFELPDGWSWCRLSSISIINGGFAFKSSEYVDKGVRVIRISDFDEAGFKNDRIVRYKYSENLKPFELEEKNIIIAMTGGTVGKSLFVDQLQERMVVNQRVATIKLIKPAFAVYINCVVPTDLIQGVIKIAKNSTNDNISMEDIRNFLIPLPPLPEQKAIVETVNQLFKEVEQLEQLTMERIQLKEQFATSALNQLASNNTAREWAFLQEHFHPFFNHQPNIKKLRETILQLAVQGKLTSDFRASHPGLCTGSNSASALLDQIKAEKVRLVKEGKMKKEKPLPAISDEEIPYELPEGWVWCRLGEITNYGRSMKKEPTDVNSNTWVLELEDVEKQSSRLIQKVRYSERRFKSTKNEFSKGDVIYGKLRPYLDKVIVADEPGVCTTEMIPIHCFGNISPEYLRCFLKSPIFIDYANNSTHGMRMPRLGTERAQNSVVSLPPLPEQKAIVETVNRLMALCDQLEQEVLQSEQQVELVMKGVLREVLG